MLGGGVRGVYIMVYTSCIRGVYVDVHIVYTVGVIHGQ